MRVVVSQFEGIEATPVLPLAAGCLVAAARSDPELAGSHFAIEVVRRPIAGAVAAYDRPDVLGFSLYPWNAVYSLAVARAARAAYPDAMIVVGGPSVPRRPERARRFLSDHPEIDVLVFSEGELAFRELLRACRRGTGLGRRTGLGHVAGLAHRDGEAVHFTDPPRRVLDFTLTASPYLDGTFDELFERHRDRFSMALCETNRGCPFSCTFCDWSLTKKVVEVPLERVLNELDWVVDHGFSHVMFADANFGIRARDPAIARQLVALRRRTGRPSTFYWYLTKNNHRRNLETIEILREGGISTWVGLAVQDFDDGVLEAVRRDNIQTDEAMQLREICGARGIPTFNELILGLPGQTYRSWTRTIATAMPPLPSHDFVLFLCRLIDNAELGSPESRARHAIETRHCQWKTPHAGWDPVIDEFQEVVVATRDLPLADWRRAYRYSWLAAALYNLRLLRVLLRYVVDRGIGLSDYLELLADHVDVAPAGSVYGEIGATLERYLGTLLGGGPFVLPLPGAEDGAPAPVDEAVAVVALRRYDEFLAETAALTHDVLAPDGMLDEAFRYQSLITPRHGRAEAVVETFQHDWPGYAAAGGSGAPPLARPTRVRFTPMGHAAIADFTGYALNHIACLRGRLEVGRVETVDGAPRLGAGSDTARSIAGHWDFRHAVQAS